jgi:hypothetical protein
MSYHKMTTIIGHKAGYVAPTAPVATMERHAQVEANRPHVVISVRAGHWKPERAVATARRMGIVGTIEITHSTGDLSGKGRGGYDRRWVGDERGFKSVDLTPAEKEYDDAADVNALYDEMECRP